MKYAFHALDTPLDNMVMFKPHERGKYRGKDWTGYLWTRRTGPTRKEMGDAAPKRPQRCFIALIGNQKNSLEFATCLARDRNPRDPNELHYRDFMRSLKSIEFGH